MNRFNRRQKKVNFTILIFLFSLNIFMSYVAQSSGRRICGPEEHKANIKKFQNSYLEVYFQMLELYYARKHHLSANDTHVQKSKDLSQEQETIEPIQQDLDKTCIPHQQVIVYDYDDQIRQEIRKNNLY